MMRRAVVAAFMVLALAGASAAEPGLVLASTTSVENSGLLGAILPIFTNATGIEVRVLALGTGQALAVTARGDADVLLVHDPVAEQTFMDQGHGQSRRMVAWNDFIIVGPAADPAHIAGGHDAALALRMIHDTQAPFVSRGDKSGTDALERRIWASLQLDPKSFGSWYKDIGGGMGAALNAAAGLGAYTLSDRGTWLAFGNKRDLRIVVAGSAALLNRYSVIVPNPAEHRPQARAAAQRFADWLTSPEGQAAIAHYTVAGETLFHPLSDRLPE